MEDRTVVAHGCRKTNKLKCVMKRKTVVAHGRTMAQSVKLKINWCVNSSKMNTRSNPYGIKKSISYKVLVSMHSVHHSACMWDAACWMHAA